MSKRPFEIAFDPVACFGSDDSALIVARSTVDVLQPLSQPPPVLAAPPETSTPTTEDVSVTLEALFGPECDEEGIDVGTTTATDERMMMSSSRCATPDPMSVLPDNQLALALLLNSSSEPTQHADMREGTFFLTNHTHTPSVIVPHSFYSNAESEILQRPLPLQSELPPLMAVPAFSTAQGSSCNLSNSTTTGPFSPGGRAGLLSEEGGVHAFMKAARNCAVNR